MLRLISIFAALLLCYTQLVGQTVPGSLHGRITKDGNPVSGAKISLLTGTKPLTGTLSDTAGFYQFQNFPPNLYNLKVSIIGFRDTILSIKITPGNQTYQDVNFGKQIPEATIASVSSVSEQVESEDADDRPETEIRLEKVEKKEIKPTLNTPTGQHQNANFVVRGARSDKTVTFVDGVRVIGSTNVPYPTVGRSKPSPSAPPPLPKPVPINSGEPLTGEEFDKSEEQNFISTKKTDTTTFSIDVDRAAYSNIRRMVNNNQPVPPEAVRIEEMINYFPYSKVQNTSGEHPFTMYSEVSECPWKPEHRLMHIRLQGKEVPKEVIPASNLVFLIDVSGSMSSENKLPLVKKSLKMLVKELRPQDRVAIAVYAGAEGVALQPTSCAEKEKIYRAIESLSSGGGTAGEAGIKLAYKLAEANFVSGGNNRVILATDGDFNIGISSDSALVKLIEEKRKTGVYLSILGFGMGNYKDGKMEKLSNAGNGNYAYIDTEKEAEKTLVKEFAGTLLTIAADVKIQMIFDKKQIKSYRLIGYDNRRLNNADFTDDKKDAGEMGAGHTVTALYEIEPVSGGVSEKNMQPCALMRVRYKNAVGLPSTEVIFSVFDNQTPLVGTTDDFRFSASVAMAGLVLRKSKFKAKAAIPDALRMAEQSKGTDPEGLRAEFIDLLRKVK